MDVEKHYPNSVNEILMTSISGGKVDRRGSEPNFSVVIDFRSAARM